MARPVNPNIEQSLKDYENKVPVSEIAQKAGVTIRTVYGWAQNAGIRRVTRNKDFDKAEIINDYNNPEMRISEIAQKHGVSNGTVHRIALQNGLTRRTPTEKRDRAVQEYGAGEKSIAEIASEYGVSPNSLYKWARDRGVTRPRTSVKGDSEPVAEQQMQPVVETKFSDVA